MKVGVRDHSAVHGGRGDSWHPSLSRPAVNCVAAAASENGRELEQHPMTSDVRLQSTCLSSRIGARASWRHGLAFLVSLPEIKTGQGQKVRKGRDESGCEQRDSEQRHRRNLQDRSDQLHVHRFGPRVSCETQLRRVWAQPPMGVITASPALGGRVQ